MSDLEKLGAFARMLMDGQALVKKLESHPSDTGEALFHWMQEAKELTSGANLGATIDDLLKQAYNPTEHDRPPEPPPVITLESSTLCTGGGIGALAALAGNGKTRALNAIVAGALNPGCDSLGFTVNVPDGRSIYFLDTELNHFESHKMLEDDLLPRAGISKETLNKNRYIPLTISELTVEDRKKLLYGIMEAKNPGLVLIDGITDFMIDPLDLKESSELIDRIKGIAIKHDIAIYLTIHQNLANSEKLSSSAPRGHIGREVYRRCQSLLCIEKNEDIYKLTTKNASGKIRWGKHDLEHMYQWDKAVNRFVSLTQNDKDRLVDIKKGSLKDFAQTLFEKCSYPMTYNETVQKIVTLTKKSEGSAKRKLQDMVQANLLLRDMDTGKYTAVSTKLNLESLLDEA